MQPLGLDAELCSELSQRGLATQIRPQPLLQQRPAAQQVAGVNGQPDEAARVGERPRHGLPDPPVHIGAEAKALAPVVFVDAQLKPNVAFLDQVLEAEPATRVASRDRHDQAQVRLDQTFACAPPGLIEPPELGATSRR